MNRDEGAAREQQGAVSTCQSPTGDAASGGHVRRALTDYVSDNGINGEKLLIAKV